MLGWGLQIIELLTEGPFKLMHMDLMRLSQQEGSHFIYRYVDFGFAGKLPSLDDVASLRTVIEHAKGKKTYRIVNQIDADLDKMDQGIVPTPGYVGPETFSDEEFVDIIHKLHPDIDHTLDKSYVWHKHDPDEDHLGESWVMVDMATEADKETGQ